MMVSSIELDSMKLFLICEDVDFGYYCHGVFDNEDVAKEQMELLIENYAFLKFLEVIDQIITEIVLDFTSNHLF